jgi:hypothetical protein
MSNQSLWQRTKLTTILLGIVGTMAGGLIACGGSQSSGNTPTPTTATPTATISTPSTTLTPTGTTPATATPVPTSTIPTITATNLDDAASQWGIFYDGGSAKATLQNAPVPSVDGSALMISLISGQPYVGIHAYRNLLPADTATNFQMNLSFYFPSATPIQALEFTMDTWVNNQRWEWALQWENIGSNTPPPPWRLWTGNSWQAIGVTQQLNIKQWHAFQIKGDISDGQVHYISFSCDNTSVMLGQRFAPVPSPGDKLAVAVQLDGDSHEDSYVVYIDKVNFQWS